MSYPNYPFADHRIEVRPGIAMHYLDEGPRDGEVLVMLHGNPSWSYYWRHAVLGLRDRYRCIVPDHVGMGLSDKPDDAHYRYTLQSRVEDLAALLQHLGVRENITLVVHDWGGMIGFGWALQHAAAVRRLVVLNTAAFLMPTKKRLPWQLKLGRDLAIGALLIRGFNAFAQGAARFGVRRRMATDERRALVSPYNSWANRIATLRFVQDIPLSPRDPAWALVEASGKQLQQFADRPCFIGWGMRDFVFDHHFLEQFVQALPQAQVQRFEHGGHYILEDEAEALVPAMRAFLDQHPL
ncbi:MAG: alpha/beta fold hydrolase [Xanthomonadaceae bacterium]|nr:alpha/beta fold hydrolase [Xanthomonadaceae bacterium]MDP2187025.1 alpha/beta fold hydrolase [Xanthomonadales bacterium]MDZ4115444.1 alpha/beta fold hydrolase [Xanthomonadaceae bacterium]MDZ4378488.1 alpha/beta fold hydrolase [Xanthomonadaceae bacterium]